MAWTKTTKGKSVLLEETVTLADSGGSNATYAVTSALPNDVYNWENKKITVKFKVSEVSTGNGGVDAYMQTSTTGTTSTDVFTPGSGSFPDWVDASANINATLNTTALTEHESHLVDMTDIYAPYCRLRFYSDGTDTQDACSVDVSIAVDAYDVLEDADIGGTASTSIGKDPS